MKIECKNYKINNSISKSDSYIEINLDITTTFPKKDIDNIKLYLNELLEDTKAYCKSPSANQIMKYHYLTRSAYKVAFPLLLFSSYKLYKKVTYNKLQIPNLLFKQKLSTRLVGIGKTMLFVIPSLIFAGAFLEYSNRLPLLYIQERLNSDEKKGKEKFKSYLEFKERMYRFRYGH